MQVSLLRSTAITPYLQGENGTESVESYHTEDDVKRRLINNCWIRGTQGILQTSETQHKRAMGQI